MIKIKKIINLKISYKIRINHVFLKFRKNFKYQLTKQKKIFIRKKSILIKI